MGFLSILKQDQESSILQSLGLIKVSLERDMTGGRQLQDPRSKDGKGNDSFLSGQVAKRDLRQSAELPASSTDSRPEKALGFGACDP